MYEFPSAAVTNDHKLSGLKQYKLNVSQSWRPEVRDQGIGRDMLPLKPPEESSSLSLPTSGGSSGSLFCGSITPIFAFVSTWLSSLCVSLCVSFSLLRTLSLDLGAAQPSIISSWPLPELHRQRPYFQIRSRSEIPCGHAFWGGSNPPTTCCEVPLGRTLLHALRDGLGLRNACINSKVGTRVCRVEWGEMSGRHFIACQFTC